MKLSFTRLTILNIFVALAAIIFLIYANGLNTPFQSDDERHIYGTPQITNVNNYTSLSNIGYRHINGLSFALNYQWGQENPFGYHLFNILIHICTTFLVFFIARLTIAKGTSWDEDAALKIALITALLFGLHPIQTETVTYISGRPGGLAGLFYFLSLLLFILASLKGSRVLRYVFYLLSLIIFFMAVLSKETAITLPVMIILYDLCFMKGPNWPPFRSRLGFYLCYPALAGAAFFLSPNVFRVIEEFFKKINLTFGLVQLDLLKHPLKLFLFPVNLTFEYDFLTQVSWASLLVSIAIVLLCVFLAFKKFYVKSSVLTFCVLWFPLTIAPTNSFMPRTHLFSERNMYIPSFGLCLFFAVILYLIGFKGRAKKHGAIWGTFLILFICTAFSAMIVQRNQVYASPSTLWADTFKKSPNKLSIGKTLSIHYLMEEDYANALTPLKALLQINTNLFDVHQNLGIAHKSLGNFPEAEKHFKEAISIEPMDPSSHFNLASLYGNLGYFVQASREFDRADALYKTTGKYPPRQFFSDKARAHNQAGIELGQSQKFEEALIQFEKSVQQNPKLLSARFNLAKLLLEFKNDPEKAKTHLQLALALNPTLEQTQVLRDLIKQIEKPAP
ncbi:MAG: tetratricopeptide repeat protein [Nitrospinota bacterium]|nr:tetratricopeptide repeat protein [Nitrospinota bacterium]